MRRIILFGFLVIGLGFAAPALTSDLEGTEYWDRTNAIAVVQSVKFNAAVLEISDLSSLADGENTVSQLAALANRADWPLPVREAALFQFARSLAELPADAVAHEVIHYLRNYQAKALVPHEEYPQAYIPLFNIRGAISGVTHGWQRQQHARLATILLNTDPEKLVAEFAKSNNPNQKAGYLDALRFASMATVTSVQNIALERLEATPGLSPIIALTAVITTDLTAIEQLLLKAQGAGLSTALNELEEHLTPNDTASLLAFAIQRAPATNAALAISAWWPRLSHDALTREMMISLLTSPELGASAAMALARSPDILTIKALKDLASSNSPASNRAQMALDLNREQLIGEVLP